MANLEESCALAALRWWFSADRCDVSRDVIPFVSEQRKDRDLQGSRNSAYDYRSNYLRDQDHDLER
uniref:Uncharacterized protein n=1 Tax=Oryza meridionalis TaxID=40149 RepID=A0A0E0EV16_9ORYZ